MIRCYQSEELLENITRDVRYILPRLEHRCKKFKADFGDMGESNIHDLLYDFDE